MVDYSELKKLNLELRSALKKDSKRDRSLDSYEEAEIFKVEDRFLKKHKKHLVCLRDLKRGLKSQDGVFALNFHRNWADEITASKNVKNILFKLLFLTPTRMAMKNVGTKDEYTTPVHIGRNHKCGPHKKVCRSWAPVDPNPINDDRNEYVREMPTSLNTLIGYRGPCIKIKNVPRGF